MNTSSNRTHNVHTNGSAELSTKEPKAKSDAPSDTWEWEESFSVNAAGPALFASKVDALRTMTYLFTTWMATCFTRIQQVTLWGLFHGDPPANKCNENGKVLRPWGVLPYCFIIALLKTTFGNRNTVVLQSQANNTKNILQHTIKIFIEFINYLKV